MNPFFPSLSNLKNEAKGLYSISTIIKLFSAYIYNIMLGTVNSAKRSATKEEIIFDSKVSDIVLATRNAQKDKMWLQLLERYFF